MSSAPGDPPPDGTSRWKYQRTKAKEERLKRIKEELVLEQRAAQRALKAARGAEAKQVVRREKQVKVRRIESRLKQQEIALEKEKDPNLPHINHSVLEAQAYAKLIQRITAAREDPCAFIEFVMRDPRGQPIVLAPFQREWINMMWKEPRIFIEASRGHGKCQPGDSTVLLADGRLARIDSLRERTLVTAYDTEHHRFVPAWAKPVEYNGERRVLEVEDEFGHRVRVTEEHPLMTFGGWVKAADLKVGDRVAVPRELDLGGQRFDPDVAWLMGVVIGDGGCRPESLTVTTGDPGVGAALDKVAAKCGWAWSVRLNSPASFNYRLRHVVNAQGRRIAGAPKEFYRLTGIPVGLAGTKRVPEIIFRGDRETIAGFLSGYLDSDGGVSALRGGVVEWYSVSRPLLEDVQHLLLRLGVAAQLYLKNGRYKGARHQSWRLVVTGAENLAALQHVLRPRGRRGQLLAGLDLACDRRFSTFDVVPAAWRGRLPASVTQHAVKRDLGLTFSKAYETTRRKAQLIARYAGDQSLVAALSAPIRWSRVTRVADGGIQPTWALEVEKFHTYVTGDFVTHNTTLLLGFLLFLMGQRPDIRIKLLAQNDARAKERLYEVRINLETNAAIRLVFPNLKPGNTGDWTKSRLFIHRTTKMKDPTLEAVGITSSIVGSRVDVVAADDIVDMRNSIIYPSLREVVKSKFLGELMPTLEPDGQVIAIGTPWAVGDIYNLLRTMPGWKYVRYAIGTPEDPFFPLWPERWTRERLKAKRAELGSLEFDRAYRCMSLTGEAVPCHPEWIRFYTRELIGDPNKLVCVQGYDLAISQAASADYFACTTILYDPSRNLVFVADAWRARLSFAEQAQAVIAEAARWRPDSILIERVGLGGALENFLREKAGVPLPLQAFIPRGDKRRRFMEITPLLEDERMWFHPNLDRQRNVLVADRGDIIGEMLEFPIGQHDDQVDSLVAAVAGLRDFKPEGGEAGWMDGDGLNARLSILDV